MSFDLAFAVDLPHGRCVGINLPAPDSAGAVDVPESALAALDVAEREQAASLAGTRRATWIGGRLALRRALEDIGVTFGGVTFGGVTFSGVTRCGATPGPISSTARGAPVLPAGFAGSISHKTTIAIAIAAPATEGDQTLGVDVEVAGGLRWDIAHLVLSAAERARVAALPEARRLDEVLFLFSAKEAIYKAIDPHLGRTIHFRAISVERAGRGALRAGLPLAPGDPAIAVEVASHVDGKLMILSARARRITGTAPAPT